jgi:hypothetical protein
MIAMILTAACFIVAIADLATPDKYEYEHIIEPVITVHVVDDLTEVCGTIAQGCAIGTAKVCDIYVGERASPNTINHEKRHCYGWSHRPGPKQEGEVTHWYPINQVAQQE